MSTRLHELHVGCFFFYVAGLALAVLSVASLANRCALSRSSWHVRLGAQRYIRTSPGRRHFKPPSIFVEELLNFLRAGRFCHASDSRIAAF